MTVVQLWSCITTGWGTTAELPLRLASNHRMIQVAWRLQPIFSSHRAGKQSQSRLPCKIRRYLSPEPGSDSLRCCSALAVDGSTLVTAAWSLVVTDPAIT